MLLRELCDSAVERAAQTTGRCLASLVDSGWCSLAIAWFPFALVSALYRLKVERVPLAAALLSGIAGFDGVLRLLRGGSDGC